MVDNGARCAIIPINPIDLIKKGDGRHESSGLQSHVDVLPSALVFAGGLLALHLHVTPEQVLKRDEAA